MARDMAGCADVLDRVMLSQSVAHEWQKQCHLFSATLNIRAPSEIPDEQAFANKDGTLELFVVIGTRKLSLIVAPGDWSWIL